ncbi:MAG: 2-oxoglutarate dehydrogenase E1 component [Proteobacteria bacterium]|nr:2-oxoglutarate dehydrogenase E1 component [Pseudomonadota bacterium]
MSDPSALHAANRAYIEQLYAQYLDSPSSVSESWRVFFADYEDENGLTPSDVAAPPPTRRSIFGGRVAGEVAERAVHTHKNAAVLELIANYRRNGHLVANLDPLGLREARQLPQLKLQYHGLDEGDLDTVFHTGRFGGEMPLRDIISRCHAIYTSSIGAEFQYIRDVKRRRWLERRIEEPGGNITLDRPTALRVLDKLAGADRFENFIHTKYLGAKRFSVEGGEAVIPLLDTLIDTAAGLGVREATIGMAHRGRLNVLANILGKAHGDIFEEFEDAFERPSHLGSGDVKYHLGYSADVETPSGGRCHLALAFNPSHLEFVAPVVEGQIRGKQDHFEDIKRKRALSIIIHGDAAIAGQGIATETINLGRLPGYDNGGTIHLVINNQIGFTTPPESSRSSEHCTDIVKVILLPVLHVNADDLAAVSYVAKLAAEYRQEFGQDIVIDLVCYRKYGHNEGDEPLFTNPVMYGAVRARKTPLEVFVAAQLATGTLTEEDVSDAKTRIRAHLEAELSRARDKDRPQTELLGGLWKGLHTSFDPSAVDWPTAVPEDKLVGLGQAISRPPPDFALNRKLGRLLGKRQAMLKGDLPVDWSMAEGLAFATLLAENHPVRLTGQDSGRGTFSHRHAVLHDQNDGTLSIPLQNLGVKQANFDVVDSPLSEAAALGFEYGYTLVRPNALVLWEAQFGDFANGAQVLIDQFVCSSEAKWNRASGLVMLLPHGYEGQGPEHSSARIERFLQLSGDANWRLVNPTLPAQLFHVLRSQLHRNYRKPLIVFTPKSLLRHAQCVSPLTALTKGKFMPVLGDPVVTKPKRIVMCSGKVYYDLLAARGDEPIALVRLEQMYPFRGDAARDALAPLLKTATELVWCQEEPMNMGSWSFVEPILRELTPLGVRYVGRPRSASPATGSKHLHVEEQTNLVRQAMELS